MSLSYTAVLGLWTILYALVLWCRGKDRLKRALGCLSLHWFPFLLFLLICLIISGSVLASFGLPKLFRTDEMLWSRGTWPVIQNGPTNLGAMAATILVCLIWSYIHISARITALTAVSSGRYREGVSAPAKTRSLPLSTRRALANTRQHLVLTVGDVWPFLIILLAAYAFPGEGTFAAGSSRGLVYRELLWSAIGILAGLIVWALAITLVYVGRDGIRILRCKLRQHKKLRAGFAILYKPFRRSSAGMPRLLAETELTCVVFLAVMLALLLAASSYKKLVPAFSFSVLLSWLTFVYFILALAKPIVRVPIVVAMLICIVAVDGEHYGYTFPDLEELYGNRLDTTPANLKDPSPVGLNTPKDYFGNLQQSRDQNEPKLVIVTTSGGAYRAAFWTATVLDHLETISSSGQGLDGLTQNLKLITGASGGMVGAAYYVVARHRHWRSGTYDRVTETLLKDVFCSQNERWNPTEQERITIEQENRRLPARERPDCSGVISSDEQLVPFDTKYPVARDSLSPVAQQLIRGDLANVFVPGRHRQDRGRVLEFQWKTLQVKVSDLAAAEREGGIPSIVFSPVIVETGQPLLIGNQDLAGLYGGAAGEVEELSRLLPQAYLRLRVATAVRMNATFPYVSPAVSLPGPPQRRLVDAGYYDNYGVNLAVAWLRQEDVVTEIRNKISGVVIVQIRAFGAEEKPPPGRMSRAFRGLTGPLQGIGSAREASMRFRNDQALRNLDGLYGKGCVKTVVFENRQPGEAVQMSWYLTGDELERVESEWNTAYNQDVLGALKQIWDVSDQGCLGGRGTSDDDHKKGGGGNGV